MARQIISHEGGMRVVTARMLSAPLRSPNPTSMSAPGQPNRPRVADPAAMQTTIGTREDARAEANMVLSAIGVALHGGQTPPIEYELIMNLM
jgi:hypothetical protein